MHAWRHKRREGQKPAQADTTLLQA
jgi:hypothetical protein